MKFQSEFEVLGYFQHVWHDDIIKNEPMFFNCDLEYAHKHGGPITKDFIERLPDDWKNCNPVLDSRVHMLKKGWLPCIGGWHHDDVPRSTETGQPNYTNPEYHSEHLMGLVNAHVSPTRFLDGVVYVSDPDINTTVFSEWSEEIEYQRKSGMCEFDCVEASSGEYIQFNSHTFHTGTKAVEDGWRWFIRLSRNTNRQKKITNEIRRQTQVYIESEMEGW